MNVESKPNYETLDRPDILLRLFHPRPEIPGSTEAPGSVPLMIPVEKDIAVGACFHAAGKESPSIVFFHGNGEIVADYHNLGPLYAQRGINFLPVDYRGYGRSGGRPGIAAMMRDCHTILDFAAAWLLENGYTGPLVVMGRSLGSASALELAAQREGDISAMILESAFAFGVPLLKLLGVSLKDEGGVEEYLFGHLKKIQAFRKPVLIIHAEHDHIIPFADGRTLFDACGSGNKSFLKISGADHNDIFFRGFSEYMAAVDDFCKGLSGP